MRIGPTDESVILDNKSTAIEAAGSSEIKMTKKYEFSEQYEPVIILKSEKNIGHSRQQSAVGIGLTE